MSKLKSKKDYFKRRQLRTRKKISGTAEIPRMHVDRTNKHLYVQFIDDVNGITLASTSTLSKEYNGPSPANLKGAEEVGKIASEKATSAGITKVVFDKSGYKFHGRIKAIADTARKNGLQF